MLKLSIMTKEELAHIFGDLDAYIPLHEGILPFGPKVADVSDKVFLRLFALFNSADLLMKLTEGTGPDGRVTEIGQIVIDWV